MRAATDLRDEELRGQIQTVLSKLDRIEARVKTVESVASVVPRLEKTLAKVESRVEERLALQPMGKTVHRPSPPPPLKAFMSGASIGFMIVGAVTAAWFLGFF